jgi:hypothetical protein
LKQAAEQVTSGGHSGLVADADADLSGAVCIPFVLQQGQDLASGDSALYSSRRIPRATPTWPDRPGRGLSSA